MGFIDILVDARLDHAIAEAMNGKPLVARFRREGTMDRIVERAINGPSSLETVLVSAAAGQSPQQALLDAAAGLVANLNSFSELCVSPYLSFRLFIVDLRGKDASRWLMLAGTFAKQRQAKEDGPALLIVCDKCDKPMGCEFLDDGAFVGPPEAAVFVRERRTAPSLLTECADAAAIEVSRGDLGLLSDLLSLPDRDRFNPARWIARQPVVEDLLPWRGHEERCATWLARYDPARFERRVWRGHVSVMFPFLANSLATLLEKHGNRLPREVPDKQTGAPIPRDEFEWGDIVFALRPTAPLQADRAHRVRLARNALAHRRPLDWQSAMAVTNDIDGLLSWS